MFLNRAHGQIEALRDFFMAKPVNLAHQEHTTALLRKGGNCSAVLCESLLGFDFVTDIAFFYDSQRVKISYRVGQPVRFSGEVAQHDIARNLKQKRLRLLDFFRFFGVERAQERFLGHVVDIA